MKYPWLYVGAKVTSKKIANNDPVRAIPTALLPGEVNAKRGEVYTVRAIRDFGDWIGLHFVEIVNPPFRGGEEGYHNLAFFGPVLPDTTKQVEEMKRLMRDHVANASGGMA
jgi:hypothetical protein